MSIRNTRENYGLVARYLHWLTAILFLVSYSSVYYRHWFTEEKTAENWTALQLHLSIGVTIAVVVTLRILWKISNRSPEPEPGNRVEHLAAKVGHLLLYAIMIVMPLTGYLGTGADIDYFFLFDITGFNNTDFFAKHYGGKMTFKDFEKPFDFIHKDIMGAWLVWLLIAGHVAAALYHHFVKSDRTLNRMLRGR